jgi:hypothetical protein
MSVDVQLVPIGSVRPSAYNPRVTDPTRLDLIATSLQKLGFVLPIYADANGEILSGHQRHMAAERLGFTHIPVVFTKPMALEQRRNVNVVFNRATNDMQPNSTPQKLVETLESSGVDDLAAVLPDKTGDARFPCLQVETVPLADMVEANQGEWIEYARNITKLLADRGILMPVIATRDRKVVNGIGRVHYLAEQQAETVDVVFITDAEAAFARVMLNLLSMDFDLHTRYADVLRHNSFRRARNVRQHLGIGMLLPLGIRASRTQFDVSNPRNFQRWSDKFPGPVLDFGAGLMEDVALLRRHQIDADAFEPYVLTGGEIDYDRSLAVVRQFLATAASGKQWATIFMQAVLNSVPFHADRRHLITLLAALTGPYSTVYPYSTSVRSSNLTGVRAEKNLASRLAARSTKFMLAYEDNIVLGEFAAKPKVQKYFTESEFYQLFIEQYHQVQIQTVGNYVTAVCQQPRGIHKTRLREAIAFEFDLPYPGERRMGLVDEALAAFSQRLGVAL